MTTRRDPPSGTSRLPGPSINFAPFSHTSNALTALVDSRTCTTGPGGGALLPASLPRPEPTSVPGNPEDPDFADPSSPPMAICPDPLPMCGVSEPVSADPPEPRCEIVAEPEPSCPVVPLWSRFDPSASCEPPPPPPPALLVIAN